MGILSSVALGWIGRRVLDWGGIAVGGIFGLIQFYNAMPPAVQEFVKEIATGNWQSITLGALPGVLLWGWSQVVSYRATVRPQIVTQQGQKADLKELPPAAQRDVTEIVQMAKPSMTVLDRLIAKMNKNR